MHLPVLGHTPGKNLISPNLNSPDRDPRQELDALARDLANAIAGEVRFGLHDRMLYATDASLYQVEPLGVVIPANIEDAARAASFCLGRGVPILPRGAGTSLAGQCTNRAVVIDLSPNCRRILDINAEARTCDVEPGISVDDLNAVLQKYGLFFAPDPATSKHANIGGCIGNNAAGARSVRYGRTSENLLGVTSLLGTGQQVTLYEGAARHDPAVADLCRRVASIVTAHSTEIRARFPRTIRRNAGYALDLMLDQLERSAGDPLSLNLAHLLCGSEGTLALTLGARLKLHPIPRAKGLTTIAFDSVDAAIDAVMPILSTRPSAVELLDDTVIDLALANAEYARYVDLMPQPSDGKLRAVLYVEYFADGDGTDEGAKAELADRFDALRRQFGTEAMRTYTEPGPMLAAWKLRKAGEPLLHGVPGARRPVTFVEDNVVPPERLGEFVREFRRIVASHGTKAAFWAHASVGVLHVRPFINLRDPEDRVAMQAIALKVAQLARSLGGVMSGEHGDGRVRGPLLEEFFGPALMGAFRDIKSIFDPRGLLNPGNIVEPRPLGSIVTNLRIEPAGSEPDAAGDRRWNGGAALVPQIDTYFDYSDQHGFDHAVEMCNGAGVCRKKTGGTMCPSYMGTLDERHSTRGRGNALRLAITGQMNANSGAGPAWNDAETIKTLDVCLSCKACKTECPSNVDIARLKAEYTAQRFKRAGVPLSTQILGQARMLGRLASRTPWLANAMNNSKAGRWAINRVLGFDSRRSIPAFDEPLPRLVRRSGIRAVRKPTGKCPAVVLFGDCFAMFNEPGIGVAAARVLTHLGYEVVLADLGCCARPMISLGMLERAIVVADSTLRRLKPLVEDPNVEVIAVLEPSCLSAFKDDWLKLKLQTPLAIRQALAAKSMLVEDYVEREWDRHPQRHEVDTTLREPSLGPVILHGHCHQKALWGVETSAKLLTRLVGPRLRVLDSGCCGMAGAFGYAPDRYDLSMKIGELVLLPAVREAGEHATIAAPGTSCRHQIHDGAGTQALHPIQIAAEIMCPRLA